MKKILCGAVAAIAVVAASAPAAAQTSERHYASVLGGGVTFENPSNDPNFIDLGFIVLGPFPSDQEVADFAAETLNLGTRYVAEADAPADSETATPTVSVAFNLSGTVNKDCSFYAGNNANATNIDFGVIGVRTGDNENVNAAFEMVGAAEANIETLTAGCNFNNTVEIEKDSDLGLVNQTASGFDSDQFQNNIPYQVTASWTGVTSQSTGVSGTAQTLNVGTGDLSGSLAQGAWRSRMDIDIVAPAVTSRGLVAGDYTGTTTLTLSAI